tara:strand:+ start:1170 stop:1796 length:627 start_codon:yes stop_codon:yes gene_type:complete
MTESYTKIIIIGFSICLSIILLTVLILSFQHITFTRKYDENDTESSPTESSPIESSPIESSPTESSTNIDSEQQSSSEVASTLLDEGLSTDEILSTLIHKENEKERCCFSNKFDCTSRTNCASGVEKRCGIFADKECDESLIECGLFNEEQCKEHPNNIFCEYNGTTEKCENIPNAHDGSEIECSQFTRFKNINFPHMKYNCENNLFI